MTMIPTIDKIKDTTVMRMIRKLAGVTDEAIGKNAESMEQTFDEENRILATTLKTVDGTEISGSVYVPGGGDGGDIVVDTINYSESVPDVFNYIRAKYAEGTYNCNINIKADLLDGTKEGDNKISFNATQFTVSHLNLPDDEDIIYQIEFQGAGESALNGTAKWLILSYTPANTGDYKYGATVTIYSYESDKDAYVNQGWYINKDVGLTLKGFVIKGIKGAAITPYTASTGIKIDDENSTIAVDSDVVMLKSIAINYTDAQFIDVYNDLKSKFPNNDFTCNLNVKCVGDATYEFVADSITIKDTHIAIGKTGMDCQIKPDGTAAISVRDSGGTWDVSPLTNPITIIGTVRNASTAITYTGENGIIVDNVDNVIKPDTDVLATKELAQKAYTSAYVENNTMTFEKGNGDTDTIALPTGGSYTAGDGITISDNEIAVDTSVIATTAVTTELASGISTNRNLINGTFDDVNISGSHLVFDKVNGEQKEIEIPSSGNDWDEIDISNPPTDFSDGDLIKICWNINYRGSGDSYIIAASTFNGYCESLIRISNVAVSSDLCPSGFGLACNSSYIIACGFTEIRPASYWNKTESLDRLFQLTITAVGKSTILTSYLNIGWNNIGTYALKMYRKKLTS